MVVAGGTISAPATMKSAGGVFILEFGVCTACLGEVEEVGGV